MNQLGQVWGKCNLFFCGSLGETTKKEAWNLRPPLTLTIISCSTNNTYIESMTHYCWIRWGVEQNPSSVFHFISPGFLVILFCLVFEAFPFQVRLDLHGTGKLIMHLYFQKYVYIKWVFGFIIRNFLPCFFPWFCLINCRKWWWD